MKRDIMIFATGIIATIIIIYGIGIQAQLNQIKKNESDIVTYINQRVVPTLQHPSNPIGPILNKMQK